MNISLENFSTQDLVKEIEKRKKIELKKSVDEINRLLDYIKSLNEEVAYINDETYVLDSLFIGEDNKVYYSEK